MPELVPDATPDDAHDAADHLLPPVTPARLVAIGEAASEVHDKEAARRFYRALHGSA